MQCSPRCWEMGFVHESQKKDKLRRAEAFWDFLRLCLHYEKRATLSVMIRHTWPTDAAWVTQMKRRPNGSSHVTWPALSSWCSSHTASQKQWRCQLKLGLWKYCKTHLPNSYEYTLYPTQWCNRWRQNESLYYHWRRESKVYWQSATTHVGAATECRKDPESALGSSEMTKLAEKVKCFMNGREN